MKVSVEQCLAKKWFASLVQPHIDLLDLNEKPAFSANKKRVALAPVFLHGHLVERQKIRVTAKQHLAWQVSVQPRKSSKNSEAGSTLVTSNRSLARVQAT